MARYAVKNFLLVMTAIRPSSVRAPLYQEVMVDYNLTRNALKHTHKDEKKEEGLLIPISILIR
jgi:hypothetical protein